jgi:hypothetical protein
LDASSYDRHIRRFDSFHDDGGNIVVSINIFIHVFSCTLQQLPLPTKVLQYFSYDWNWNRWKEE